MIWIYGRSGHYVKIGENKHISRLLAVPFSHFLRIGSGQKVVTYLSTVDYNNMIYVFGNSLVCEN